MEILPSAATRETKEALKQSPVAIYRVEPGNYLGIKGCGITKKGKTFFVMNGEDEPSEKTLSQARIFNNPKIVDGALSAPHKVYLDPTLICPCSCAHCSANVPLIRSVQKANHEKIPELNKNDGILISKQIVESGAVQTKIAGGEPFTWKPFAEVIEILGEAGIGLSMSTSWYNLVDINSEMIDLLMNYGMKISVSLDGPEEYHDKNRSYPGLHNKALAGIRKLRELGYPKNKIEIRSTIADSPDAVNHAIYLYEEIAKKFEIRTRIRMARPTGGALTNGISHLESNGHYWDLFNTFRQFKKNHLINFDDPVNYDDNLDSMVLKTGLDCGAGSRQMTINAKGEAMPCSFIDQYFSPINVIEYLKQGGSLLDVWRGEVSEINPFKEVRDFHSKRSHMVSCGDCGFKHGCQGGCPTYGLAVSKDPNNPQPDPRCPTDYIAKGGLIYKAK